MLLVEKLKMPFDQIPVSHKVWWKCDYCGIEFEREIKVMNRACKNSPHHSCGEKECKRKKKQDGCMVKYGVSHVSQLPDIKAKKVQKIKDKMPETLEKMKQTNLKKYGSEYASQNELVKEKMKETCLAKYGTESSLQNDVIKEKTKETNLKKYGAEFAMQSSEVKEARKQTNLQRYGVENAAQSEIVKNKIIESNLKNHGVPYAGMREDVQEKIKQTNLEKYGVATPLQNEDINTKRKATNLEKYGVEHIGQVEEFKERSKQSCLKKYGHEFASQSKKVLQKMIQTNLAKYGVISPSMLEETKNKIKQTCLQKYGVEFVFMSDEIQKKINKTMVEKHGAINPLKSFRIKQKQQATMLEKYGAEHGLQVPHIRQKAKNTLRKNYGVDSPLQNKEIIEKKNDTCIRNYGSANPMHVFGKTQEEIKMWLADLGYNFVSTTKILGGKEIDLYNDELKIAIEYCGLYWHNELSPQPRTRRYHFDKYKNCQKKGIRLLTIFEDEWITKNSQCKSFIKSIFNKNARKIFARKCEVKIIEKTELQEFCNKYHIQGANRLSLICFGLFYDHELVGCMSFGRHHRNRQEIILDRLCFKEDTTVVGGSSKLFSACCMWAKNNGFKEVSSWSDNRWSVGEVYKKLGFVLLRDMDPDYSYVDLTKKCVRKSKQSQRKLVPTKQTERQICLEKGFARIWDCGKKKWIFTIT